MSKCCLETNCVICCRETNMLLSYNDIETIQKLGYKTEFFVVEHNGWLQLKNRNGRCVFHDGTKCTIYQHKPEGCDLYPVVYDNNEKKPILDNECPQRPCFQVSKEKSRQLILLIHLLKKERTNRLNKKSHKHSQTD
jgi:Fe-S-cluster containining protein